MATNLESARLTPRRAWIDRLTRGLVGLGGAGVIAAITLIFVYLVWVVAPIFIPASIDEPRTIGLTPGATQLVDMSENNDALLRVTASGLVEFYDPETGAQLAAYAIGAPINQAQRVYPTTDLYALRDAMNRIWFVQARYIVSFDGATRTLAPQLHFPFGDTPLPATTLGNFDRFDLHYDDEQLTIASATATRVLLTQFSSAIDGARLSGARQFRVSLERDFQHLFMGPRAQWVYLLGDDGTAEVLGIRNVAEPQMLFRGQVVAQDAELTAVAPLLGRYSLIVADGSGRLSQWVMVPNELSYHLARVRSFSLDAAVERIVPEPRRKGFATLAANGDLNLLYSTSRRVVASQPTALSPSAVAAIAPRSNYLLATDDNRLTFRQLHNEHPEISLSTLWSKIWYEGYTEPVFSWQSSSAGNDFEPKFSLVPLAFGTLKAAFYALLFAVPLAIMGAVYTAYFMAPAMRALVKPGIEIMAALPTVILGFIGGLWLAPLIEANLSSVLGIFVVLPLGLFAFALAWWFAPNRWTAVFTGWYGLIVIPLIVVTVALAFSVGPWLENQLFGGNSRIWLRDVLGLSFDQRNALVVGLVMGLAVIPTIFSIAEDAIYSVPRHLVNGSLALGATPWQTLVRVVLLTASPGIFSAVMIGMGRAVGETMIVLMATGNTPLMDFNIFEGMRTFAANIAVELPESEVDSSHYRILFLAALVLFLITFAFNTIAEIVRQRLRERYGSL